MDDSTNDPLGLNDRVDYVEATEGGEAEVLGGAGATNTKPQEALGTQTDAENAVVAPEHSPVDPALQKPKKYIDKTYDLDGIDHEIVRKYQPKYLAKGGEHIVYEIPDHPNIVLKANTAILKRILTWNAKDGLPTDQLPKDVEDEARNFLYVEDRRYRRLQTYFGKDTVLGQRKMLVKVPVNEKILNDLYEGNPPAVTGNEAWTIVMMQKKAEEINDPNHLALRAGYAEREEVSFKVYNEITDRLVFGRSAGEPLTKEKLMAVQQHLRPLLTKLDGNENLKAAVKAFVEKSITYTEETGEILDLAGPDNVIFSEQNGHWTSKVVDGLYPDDGSMVDHAKIILLKHTAGTALESRDRTVLLNAFNYVRAINGLRELLGVDKRIEIIPELAKHLQSSEMHNVITG